MEGVDAIREAGWTQGSVLEANDGEAEYGLSGETSYIVSHPCDVVSSSLVRDPSVQLIRLHRLEAIDGNFTFGKNPRRLHMDLEPGAVEIRFDEMHTIDRTILTAISPSQTISEGQRRVLASWLAAKYARPAFADEFNRRLEPARRKLEKILKTAGTHASGIYVATSLDELPIGESYKVVMALTMTMQDSAVAHVVAEVSAAADEIALIVGSMDGIELTALETVSEEEFSLAHLRVYARWDYDSLSHRDGEEAVFPPRE